MCGKLADAFTVLRPETRVLFITGYTEESILGPHAPGHRDLLQKPFTRVPLLDKVRALLDAE